MAHNIDFILRNGLQVMANVAIGQYATVNAAPINGMIVSGNVGIGTSTISAGNIFAVDGNEVNYGNIYLVEPSTGISFSDGSFIDSAYTLGGNITLGTTVLNLDQTYNTINGNITWTGEQYYSTGIIANAIISNTTVIAETGLTIAAGGFNATGNSTLIGNLTIGGDESSINPTTGALVINGPGGLGVGGNVNIGGSFSTEGNANISENLIVGSEITTNTVVLGSTAIGAITSISLTETGNSSVNIDQFSTSTYRTAHYVVQISDTTDGWYHSAQIILVQNGTYVYKTEYNEMYSNVSIGNFDANLTSNIVSLTFTANNNINYGVHAIRTAISV